MKARLLAIAIAAAAAAGSGPAYAAALAASDLNVTAIFLSNAAGVPLSQNANIQVLSESRTGAANASYNGVAGTGGGSGNAFGPGQTVDVPFSCAGPACGTPALTALYGGTLENNTTTKLTAPPSQNFALGDMLIQGSAIGGAVTGLTRADASANAATNFGSANATILNSAALQAVFAVPTTFTGRVAVTASAYLTAFLSLLPGEFGSANSGQSFSLTVTCSTSGGNNCGAFTTLSFSPDQLNQTRFVSNPLDNDTFNFNGTVISDERTFLGGTRYNLAINQASNAAVVDRINAIPEPSSIALVGLALTGLGVGLRRKKKLAA